MALSIEPVLSRRVARSTAHRPSPERISRRDGRTGKAAATGSPCATEALIVGPQFYTIGCTLTTEGRFKVFSAFMKWFTKTVLLPFVAEIIVKFCRQAVTWLADEAKVKYAEYRQKKAHDQNEEAKHFEQKSEQASDPAEKAAFAAKAEVMRQRAAECNNDINNMEQLLSSCAATVDAKVLKNIESATRGSDDKGEYISVGTEKFYLENKSEPNKAGS